MKKGFLFLTCILFLGLSESFAQNYNNWAVGFRVGEPIGINVRKYFAEGTRNFDVNIGTYGLLWGNHREYQGGTYYDQAGWMIQGIYHWNKEFGSNDRSQFYYGFGGQINQRRRPPESGNRTGHKTTSLGGAGNVGLEFGLPSNDDLSFFMDGGVYIEALPKILFLAPTASVGLRLKLFGN